MTNQPPAHPGAAIGLDHIGIVGASLDDLAAAFAALGFALTPEEAHASGRTANRCVMLPGGGYLELIAKRPGQESATLDRFLATGPGAHILALEVADETAAAARLSLPPEAVSVTERAASGQMARFALAMPPDPPECRVLLIRHLTRDLLWHPGATSHPNRAFALTEAVFATEAPAAAMARLSRLSGRPAEPDPLGGYRIPLARGCIRILPRTAAAALFPGRSAGPSLVGLTLSAGIDAPRAVAAGGVALRLVPLSG